MHSEACNALGASDGVIHSSISLEVVSLRATANDGYVAPQRPRRAHAEAINESGGVRVRRFE